MPDYRSRRTAGAVAGRIRRAAELWASSDSTEPCQVRTVGAELVLASKKPPDALAWLEYLARILDELKLLVSTIAVEVAELPRKDQALAARQWGIGYSARPDLDEYIFREALRRLSQHARDAAKIYDLRPGWRNLHLPGLFYEELESLMLDVLNEHTPVAAHGTLMEDFLERTDLRVRYADLKRNRGARVQVSWSATPENQFVKSGSFVRREEYVFLSPLELSRASKRWPEPGQWAARFRRALEERHAHPFGPAFLLPEAMREEIREYVHREARRTTEELRRRESEKGVFHTRRKRPKLSGERPA